MADTAKPERLWDKPLSDPKNLDQGDAGPARAQRQDARAEFHSIAGKDALATVDKWQASSSNAAETRPAMQALVDRYGRPNAEPIYQGSGVPDLNVRQGTTLQEDVAAQLVKDGEVSMPLSSWSSDQAVSAKFARWESSSEERTAAGAPTDHPYVAVLFRADPGATTSLPIANLSASEYFQSEREHVAGGTYKVLDAQATTVLDDFGKVADVVVATVRQK